LLLFGEGLGTRLGTGNVQTELELTADIENSSIRCFPTLRTYDRSRDEKKVSKYEAAVKPPQRIEVNE